MPGNVYLILSLISSQHPQVSTWELGFLSLPCWGMWEQLTFHFSPGCDPISPPGRVGIAAETSSVQGSVVFLSQKGYRRLKILKPFLTKRFFSPSAFIVRQVPGALVHACNIFDFIHSNFCVHLNVRIGADRNKSPVNSFANYQEWWGRELWKIRQRVKRVHLSKTAESSQCTNT